MRARPALEMHAQRVPSFAADDAAAVDAFRRDGVVHLRGAFAPRWLDLAARGIARNLAHPGPFHRDHTPPGSPGRYLFDFWTWSETPEFRELIHDSPAGAIAARLLGADAVRMVMDNWFLREAGATAGAPWHHDEPYFDFEGRLCVLWLPLEPVTGDEGLTFVRGSHRWGRLFAAPQFSDNVPFRCEGARYEPVPDVEREYAGELLGARTTPGDCLVFDFRTLHGATAGARPLPRTARRMTLRFAAEGARVVPRGEWTREISAHLVSLGQVPGAALDSPLTPRVWPRGPHA